jgi:hypothetical protein
MKRFRFLFAALAAVTVAAAATVVPMLGASAQNPKHDDLIGNDEFRARCVTVQGESRLRLVEPACAYLASFLSHDGSKIPLAPDVWRIEQGRNTGTNADQIRASVESPAFDVIADVRDIRWFLDGENAIAYYVLDLVPGIPDRRSVLLAERFRVVDRLITEIEVVFIFCPVTAVNTAVPNGQSMCPASF